MRAVPGWVRPALTVLGCIALIAFGWRLGADHEIANAATRKELAREVADAVEIRVGKRIAAIRVVNQTINAKVRETLRENTVYRDCLLDEPTKRLLDAARAGGAAPGTGRGGLPGAGASAP